jgi:ATP-binding cassette subfamily C (CFTR/MRP) protein 4
MKYRPELDYVLGDLSIQAKPGEKIGCVGITGAGKSTILQILFRMVELDKQGEHKDSTFVKIDDLNIENMGLHLLRSNISIIPQIPMCFTGTIKKNLDPIGTFSEEELWRVLEDINLKSYVESLKNGLNTDMTDVSYVFSVGQKQLICLARAILMKKKILVLDEATANIDMQTDNFIQKKINEKFQQSTIFTIAHRLTTVAHYDKILVLDKGRRMEYDHPYKLLVNEIGDDSITKKDGYFASMVLNTGEKTSSQILEVAKQSYNLNREQ